MTWRFIGDPMQQFRDLALGTWAPQGPLSIEEREREFVRASIAHHAAQGLKLPNTGDGGWLFMRPDGTRKLYLYRDGEPT